MELAVMQGVAHQPRRRSKRDSAGGHSHIKGPYETRSRSSRTSGGAPSSAGGSSSRGDVLGEVTNSPKPKKTLALSPLGGGAKKSGFSLGLGGAAVMEDEEEDTPSRMLGDSPGAEEWFLAPRKGKIGKAR
jgi:hypothetical protein